jgi:hypothetical protein
VLVCAGLSSRGVGALLGMIQDGSKAEITRTRRKPDDIVVAGAIRSPVELFAFVEPSTTRREIIHHHSLNAKSLTSECICKQR